MNATLTVNPLTPSVSASPDPLVGGTTGQPVVTVTVPADVENNTQVFISSNNNNALACSCYIYPPVINAGSNSVTFEMYAEPVSQATQVTITAQVDGQSGSTNITIEPTGWMPPPTVNPADAGSPSCPLGCGGPINLASGNVWVSERDYSLPGLGGGLELTRSWNSQWQDAAPPSIAGMFGNSWRSTYEEQLSFQGSNTLMYWRADGSGWTFTYNSALGIYGLSSPPDERAQIATDPVTGNFNLTFADGMEKVFNSNGQLLTIVDRNGNQVSLTYDGSNRLTTVTDAAGRTLTFNYGNANSPNLVSSVQDATGQIAQYTYDANSNLTQVLYPDGSAFNFSYDASNMLLNVTDADGKLIEVHTYDSQHRGLTSTRADGADSVTLTYTSAGVTTLNDSMSNTTTYGYTTISGKNYATSVTGPGCDSCGGRGNQTLTYDASGNVSSSTDALNRTTNFTYDSNGNVLSRSIQLDSNNTLTWSYTYNQFQEVLTSTDPMGNVTTNTYDSHGNLLSTTTPPPSGSGSGFTTSFTYDSKGELTKVTDPLNNATTIAYNAAGLISSVTDAQNHTTSFAYDARGNRLTSKDVLNNTTQFTYNVMNRLTSITQPGNIVTSFAYDTRGRRKSVTDADNHTTSYQYDDADRLLAVTDAANNVTSYQYDTENHLASITDALGRVTSFAYDAQGRVTGTTFPSTLSESYNYDAVGNLTSKTDRNGHTITYTYDNLDRLTSKSYPDSTGVTYTYDNDSRLSQVTDPTGTYSFTYDNLGRLTGTTTNYSFLNSRSLIESYSYDADSNRTSFTDPEGGVTNYTYDTLNRLATLTDFSNKQSTFSYDALSRRTGLSRPNGVSTTYSYDNLSRLLEVLHQAGSNLVESKAYTYDGAGNRLSMTETTPGSKHGTTLTKTTDYTYDAIYEVTQAVVNGNTTDADTYDAVGNRLTDLSGGTYTYNNSNELTSYPAYSWTYDSNGNTTGETISGGGTTSYTWDYENRMTNVTLPNGGGTVTFKYDPFGRRIEKVSSSGTTIYAYDGDNIVETLDATGTATAEFTQGLGIDKPLEVYEGHGSYYYSADGLGSIVALTKSNGSAVNTYFGYNTFGAMPKELKPTEGCVRVHDAVISSMAQFADTLCKTDQPNSFHYYERPW